MRSAACRDFLLLAIFWALGGGKELVWKYDSDIGNAENWVGGGLGADCKGLHFAEVNSAAVYVRELVTAEVTLPRDGEIFMETDGFIEFKDNKKCINLKPINYHDWYDPDSWRLQDTNVAIPDKEKIPCSNDDVTFPNIEHIPITFSMSGRVAVGSVKTNKEVLTGQEPQIYQITNDREWFGRVLEVSQKKCQDHYGCLCHATNIYCPSGSEDHPEAKKTLLCKDPVTPEDFCHEICGAYVTYKPGHGPSLDQVTQKLKEYDGIDAHVSRVKNYLGSEVVQVVFAEKEYTGRSLQRADSFMQFLHELKTGSAQMFKSGEFYMEGGGSWSIIFGSLLGVLVVFGLIFYLYGDRNANLLISRLQRSRGSIFTAPFFARFDNTDGQSESGSILDITKSFDNPMYDQSTSTSPIQEVKPQTETFDNPMFGQASTSDEKAFDNPLFGEVPTAKNERLEVDSPTARNEDGQEAKSLDFDNPLYENRSLDVAKAPEAEE